jgi:hypothetical protein
MTLDEAMAVVDSRGRPYSSVSDAGLVRIQRSIEAKINDEDVETQSRHQTALEAIKVLLAHPERFTSPIQAGAE